MARISSPLIREESNAKALVVNDDKIATDNILLVFIFCFSQKFVFPFIGATSVYGVDIKLMKNN
ncbi:hypothetical protein VCHA50P415_30423 [Vibrio chagasii]|nr:hypothetical protein VCHA27O13_30079 [Vibrio chagasii]CAH6794947.1 hypothetical protein VCHA34P112_100045 [Vibrio chagasii]CAH6844091.1 hypothetical protein VCHA35O142_10516 [Vibrio chagasii]CAH6879546.1 hypothetical protein VCHA34P121_20250 [Vibrio chagasii]CAH6897890.1 hypothetical protein VCHA34P120_20168 [Vibrio chagasii]